jgi:hypothetical protein
MDFDSLVRADMQRKIMKLDGQIVTCSDLVDHLYNYDYFIGDTKKAIQFITDYADEFIEALNKYYQRTGKQFVDMQNPLKVATLMTLYKGQEIAKECENLRAKWDEKIIINTNSLDILLQELEGQDLPLNEKVFTTKETLDQACAAFLCVELEKMLGKCETLNQAVQNMGRPELTNETIKSILKNSYNAVTVYAKYINADTGSLKAFIADVVQERTKDIAEKELGLDKKQIVLTDETFKLVQSMMQDKISHAVEFKPQLAEREPFRVTERELQKELQRETPNR